MDREPSSSGRPSRTTTQSNHLLEWVQQSTADEPVGKPAKTAAKTAAKPAVKPAAKPTGTSTATSTTKSAATASAAATETSTLTVTIDEDPLPDLAPERTRRTHDWWRNGKVRGLAAVAVVALVGVGVYSMGDKPSVPGISGAVSDAPSSAAPTQVDQTKVAALMKQISANPKDKTALQALGDVYFEAGDFKTASTWEQKIIAIDPKDVTALLALGACQFNLGDGVAAEKNWQTVVSINPRQIEAHYDLGFLYLSKSPPDMAKVKQEWNKVVEIDPKSEVAKSVQSHLKSLESRSPSAAATTSGK